MPPNFVFILADDLGYDDIGCYWTPNPDPGFERIETPVIDSMARDGIRFTSFCMGDSICTPSRAAFLTGSYPARIGMSFPPEHHGVLRHDSPEGLAAGELTIAELLGERGYATLCVGKWHLGNRVDFLPTRHGFEEYYGPVSRGKNQAAQMLRGEAFEEQVEHEDITARYTQEVIRFMRQHRESPFFVYLSHGMPHVPLGVRSELRGASPRGLYGDVVTELDTSTGQILAALDELGLDRDTLVVFTSDNGPALPMGDHGGKAFPLRGGKSSAYEGGFRVPCVMRWPGRIPPGQVCGELATAMDFLPTFCRLAGGMVPDDRTLDGHDIWDMVRGVPGVKSPYEAFHYYRRAGLRAVRSGKWKLHFDESGQPVALYDLERDAGEQRDQLADQEAVASRLMALAESARTQMGDARSGIEGRARRPVGISDSPSVKSLMGD